MPRLKFLKDFDFKPVPQQTFSYKEGDIVLVKQEVADKAIREGKAELTEFSGPSSGIKETIKKYNKKKTPSEKEEETKDDVVTNKPLTQEEN